MRTKKHQGKTITLKAVLPEALHHQLKIALLQQRLKIVEWVQQQAERTIAAAQQKHP